MKELDLLVENYFTETFEASDLLRLVEQVMNEDSEGQSGTAFEDVIVDVARRGFKKEETNAEGEITFNTRDIDRPGFYALRVVQGNNVQNMTIMKR